MKLWKRRVEVNLNGKLVTEAMKLTFKIEKSIKAKPNTAELQIWNLSQETRAAMQQKYLPVSIMAGYEEEIGLIFNGRMRNPVHKRESADIITTLQAGDGEAEIRTARISKSYKKGTKTGDILGDLAKTLKDKGINVEDALKKLKDGKLREAISEIGQRLIANGSSWDILTGLLSGTDLEASVQDGTLQVVEKGKATQDDAILLSSSTGMIGSPEPGEKGIIKVKALLNPKIYPGRKLNIKGQVSKSGVYGVDGFFRCESVIFNGDTMGQDWYAEIEALPL